MVFRIVVPGILVAVIGFLYYQSTVDLQWNQIVLSQKQIDTAKSDYRLGAKKNDILNPDYADDLVDICTNELGYVHLEQKSPEELIRMLAHMVEHITEPHYLAYLTADPFSSKPNARIRNSYLETLIELQPDFAKKSKQELVKASHIERQKLTKLCANDIIAHFLSAKKPTKTVCHNNVSLLGQVFHLFKKQYPQLDHIEFIPLGSLDHMHLWAGFYDTAENQLLEICTSRDDLDSAFNKGQYKLDWYSHDLGRADIHYQGYFEFVEAKNAYLLKKSDAKTKLEAIYLSKSYFQYHALYMLCTLYTRQGQHTKAKKCFLSLLGNGTIYDDCIFSAIMGQGK